MFYDLAQHNDAYASRPLVICSGELISRGPWISASRSVSLSNISSVLSGFCFPRENCRWDVLKLRKIVETSDWLHWLNGSFEFRWNSIETQKTYLRQGLTYWQLTDLTDLTDLCTYQFVSGTHLEISNSVARGTSMSTSVIGKCIRKQLSTKVALIYRAIAAQNK